MNAARTTTTALKARGTFDAAQMQQLHGLHESIVEICQHAMLVQYHPADSRQFHVDVIAWAIEWEALFWVNVDSDTWHEDEWIERTEDFALAKLADVRHDCLSWKA